MDVGKRRWIPLGILAATLGPAACADPPRPRAETETLEVLSGTYTIDTIYKSMQGPAETVRLAIGPSAAAELVWITGYRAEVVGADGVTPLPPEFMCHSNLAYDAAEHARRVGWQRRTANRLFTVSQGQATLRFPEGFGIPVWSDEVLTLTTQVLNHNRPDTTIEARVRVTLEYVRDRNAPPMTALYMRSANALVALSKHDGHFGAAPGHGMDAAGADDGMAASTRVIEDRYGRRFAGHWILPPGRQETTTDVTNWMRVPDGGRVHFIAVHVHPFAESLTLRDVSADRDLFRSSMTGIEGRIGLEQVEHFASAEGLELASDHRYALESVYDNTSGLPQEAMAVMYLYLADDEFTTPRRRRP